MTGYHKIPAQKKDLGVTVANVGPISVAIDANQDTFQFYKEGIYYDLKCSSKDLDHEFWWLAMALEEHNQMIINIGLSRTSGVQAGE